jgi:hypothetical protein
MTLPLHRKIIYEMIETQRNKILDFEICTVFDLTAWKTEIKYWL